ncbi:MAG TPA: hypothetical protein VGC64_11620 [Pyrinomonadaceae bacterium]
MQTGQSATVGILQTPATDERVEVIIEEHEGNERVVLRQSTWTEGLGWCSQKTMRLDAVQLIELQRALTVARHRINRKQAASGQLRETAQVIQLPTLA